MADRSEVVRRYGPRWTSKARRLGAADLFARNCQTCHARNGRGAKVGPDLIGVAGRPGGRPAGRDPRPSREVAPDGLGVVVAHDRGQTFTGLLAEETPAAVRLRRAEGIDEVIPAARSRPPPDRPVAHARRPGTGPRPPGHGRPDRLPPPPRLTHTRDYSTIDRMTAVSKPRWGSRLPVWIKRIATSCSWGQHEVGAEGAVHTEAAPAGAEGSRLDRVDDRLDGRSEAHSLGPPACPAQ